jgi:hypothetical protein
MAPRIDYENPLATGRPERLAGSDKIRRENRKRRSNGNSRRRKRHEGDNRDEPEQAGEGELNERERLGKRIDLEA